MSNESREAAYACGRTLAAQGGVDVLVIDVSKASGWTDYFVVATATSSTHMRGLLRHLEESAAAAGLSSRRRPSPADDEQWCLVDYGDVVVHLMGAEARSFYDLEALWFEAPRETIQPGP